MIDDPRPSAQTEFAIASELASIPATWMRGGTSKALFFQASDLPTPGEARDALIKRAMGCPHHLQIDGMGGSRGNTSKIAIIGASSRKDADIEYTFAQVGIDEDFIDYRATCGNISAAVGPFALMKGLVQADGPEVKIRIYNSNIDDILVQTVPVVHGRAGIEGDFENAGVPGTGAEIFTNYSKAVGRRTGKMLPSGQVVDTLQLADGRTARATLLDVGNPVAYVLAADLDLAGTELPEDLLKRPGLLATISEIRNLAAKRMNLAGFSVRVGIVSPPVAYVGMNGAVVPEHAADIVSRFYALDYCAPNYPGSASVSTGAAARLPGSTVYDCLPIALRRNGVLRIGHPNGVMKVQARAKPAASVLDTKMLELGFGRTARPLMDGTVFVPLKDLR